MIWFSFSLRASRERLAATLFFFLRDQYLSSWETEDGDRGGEGGCRRHNQTGNRTAAYLLVVWNKDLLGLLYHGLRFQLLHRKLVLARVEELPPGHAGQNQVCGIWLEINVHLNGFWVNGGRSVALS